MKSEDYYNRQKGCETKFLIILAAIILLISCEKDYQMYNWSCTITEIRYYDQKCPDTLTRQITHFGATQEEHLMWIKSIPDEEQIIFEGDTLLIRMYVDKCGKLICF